MTDQKSRLVNSTETSIRILIFRKEKKPAKQNCLVGRNWMEEKQEAVTSTIGLAARRNREPFPLHALVGLRKPLVLDVDFELHH